MGFHRRFILCLALAVGMGVLQGAALCAVHPDVRLKAADGSDVTDGVPYSPKQTCGLTSCHASIAQAYGIGNIYEGNVTANATKEHYYSGLHSYTDKVPYPVHGVTAGYHFQQGRNLDWGDVQREFYGLPSFTSSGGMYGKY